MGTRGSSHAQERRYPLAATFGQSNKSRKLDDPIKDGIFPQAVPPRRPALGEGDGGGGKREREGHRSCWADSEVRSHNFILAKLTEGVSIDDYSTLTCLQKLKRSIMVCAGVNLFPPY